MSFLNLSKLKRKRITVVITCLLIAILGWLLLALNNQYTYSVKTIMLYKNFPQNRAFHPLQSDTVDLLVKGSGWELIFEKFRIKPESVDIDLAKLNRQDFLVFSNQLPEINKMINSTQKVVGADPDTLYFNFTKSYLRKIPIRLQRELNYKNQFGQSADIELKPAYVNIRGPLEILDSLKFWVTDTLKLDNIDKKTVLTVKLKNNAVKNVMVFPTTTQVTIPVEEFTEKIIEVPIKVYNNNAFHDVNIYPRKAFITLKVPFSKYHKIDADRIVASVDLNDWKYKKHRQLTVKVLKVPDFCELVNIDPIKVDFLIEK